MRLSHLRRSFVAAISCNLLLSACAPTVNTVVNEDPATNQTTVPEVVPPADSQLGVPPPSSAVPQERESGGDPAATTPVAESVAPPSANTPAPQAPSITVRLPGTPETIVPDDESIRRAEAAASPDDLRFVTAEVIDGQSYGLVGDGRTDNTQVFQRLLMPGNRTINVPPGDYVTNRLEFSANTVLLLAPGVIIRDAGLLGPGERLLNIRTQNVWISGLGAQVVANRDHYTTGEQRHGVFIFGARRILIEGLESTGHGGDGFYIGGPPRSPSTDILLSGCIANNNRRQGLSITSARRVRIIDSEFVNTNGTAPQAGIDLEPNSGIDVLDGITLLRPQTRRNAGGGIAIDLHRLTSASEPVEITVIDHRSELEWPHLRTYTPVDLRAVLRYSGERTGE